MTASNVQMTGKEIAQPIKIPSLTLNLTPSQIQSTPFNVTSRTTVLNAQLGVRDYASPQSIVDVTIRAPNAQLPAILSLQSLRCNGPRKGKWGRHDDLDLHAAGAIKSFNKAEITQALDGSVNLDFNNVKYSGANLASNCPPSRGSCTRIPRHKRHRYYQYREDDRPHCCAKRDSPD